MSKDITNALIHLRVHFSILLLPVYLFALSQANNFGLQDALIIFIVLHLLVYPSSNAYNSYHDQDQGSIGGLKTPPPANRLILKVSVTLDILAIAISSLCIHLIFGVLISAYILASRAYSNRQIRIKKHPYLGFLLVIFFQGAFTFISSIYGLTMEFRTDYILAALATSLQIGAVYPISQIYQHKEDLSDGVKTISYILGYKGTFYFAAGLFALATLCYASYFGLWSAEFHLLLLFQLPLILAFGYWYYLVSKDSTNANFSNTMRFNVLAAFSFNLYYLLLIIAF